MLRITGVGILVVLAVLSACSKSDPVGRVLGDGCQFLSAAEAGEFLESTPEPARAQTHGEQGSRPLVTQCLYYSKAESGPYRSVGVLVRLAAEGEKPEGALDRHVTSLKRQLGTVSLATVGGLGDGAVWDPGSKQLTFFLGADMVILTVLSPDADGGLERVTRLAKKLAAKVPR